MNLELQSGLQKLFPDMISQVLKINYSNKKLSIKNNLNYYLNIQEYVK